MTRKKFAEYDCLNLRILKILKKNDFKYPTDVQLKILDLLSEDNNRDTVAMSRAGTGKTLSYLLVIFNKLLQLRERSTDTGPFAMIILPSKELALQVYNVITKVFIGNQTSDLHITASCILETNNKNNNTNADILVTTIKGIQKVQSLHKEKVNILVIDEFDAFIDYCLYTEIISIMSQFNSNLANSKTRLFITCGTPLPKDILINLGIGTGAVSKNSNSKIPIPIKLYNPILIDTITEISPPNDGKKNNVSEIMASPNLSEYYHIVDKKNCAKNIIELINEKYAHIYSILILYDSIFSRTKSSVDTENIDFLNYNNKFLVFVNSLTSQYRLKLYLDSFFGCSTSSDEFNNSTVSIINNLFPTESTLAIIGQFNRGLVKILIVYDGDNLERENSTANSDSTTGDSLTRGIDYTDVTTVINFDVPVSFTSYYNRIGRACRGLDHITGTAITFLGNQDEIETFFGYIKNETSLQNNQIKQIELSISQDYITPFNYRTNDILSRLPISNKGVISKALKNSIEIEKNKTKKAKKSMNSTFSIANTNISSTLNVVPQYLLPDGTAPNSDFTSKPNSKKVTRNKKRSRVKRDPLRTFNYLYPNKRSDIKDNRNLPKRKKT